MNTTISSTEAEDQERARREGSILWAKTKPLLDKAQQADALEARVQALQSELQQAKAAPIARMAKARTARTDRLEALVLAAIDNMRARLDAATPTSRTSLVLEHLENKAEYYGITKPPSREVVKRVLTRESL
jgi:molecular chaperone GrpE (heat shock protein)